MNRQISRIFLVLVMGILVIAIPAQAAHASQSGSSLPVTHQNTGVNVSPVLPATNSPLSVEKVYGTDSGSSVSLPLPVQQSPVVINSRGAQESPATIDQGTQAGPVNTNRVSSPLPGTSAGSFSQSGTGNNTRPDAAGGIGSPDRTSGENAAGTPEVQGQSRESGRPATISPVTGGVAGSASGSRNDYTPVPETGREPSPQGQHHGPPAQSGNYPCGPAQASPLPVASGQTRDESKEDTAPRQRPKRTGFLSWILEPPDPDLPSAPSRLPSLFPFNMLLFGGFRRISKKNVLEHDARHALYQAITATPGIDVKTLTDITGISENTLRYHMDRLTSTGKISCFARPGIVRYFPNQ